MAVSTSLTIKPLLSYHTVNNYHIKTIKLVDGMNSDVHVTCTNHCLGNVLAHVMFLVLSTFTCPLPL